MVKKESKFHKSQVLICIKDDENSYVKPEEIVKVLESVTPCSFFNLLVDTEDHGHQYVCDENFKLF